MRQIQVLEGKVVAPEGLKVGIIASRFNEIIVNKLLGGAVDGLVRHGVEEDNITAAWVPGAFEIPIAASRMARSGKYVPGLMGTLFSFVDKMISSLGSTIVGLMCAAIGFTAALPDANTSYSPQLKFVGLFCLYGLVIIGLLCNIAAMRFYPLTKEKMEEIQGQIAEIKAKAVT